MHPLERGSVLTCRLAVSLFCWNVTGVGDGCHRRKNSLQSSFLANRGPGPQTADLLPGGDLRVLLPQPGRGSAWLERALCGTEAPEDIDFTL